MARILIQSAAGRIQTPTSSLSQLLLDAEEQMVASVRGENKMNSSVPVSYKDMPLAALAEICSDARFRR